MSYERRRRAWGRWSMQLTVRRRPESQLGSYVVCILVGVTTPYAASFAYAFTGIGPAGVRAHQR